MVDLLLWPREISLGRRISWFVAGITVSILALLFGSIISMSDPGTVLTAKIISWIAFLFTNLVILDVVRICITNRSGLEPLVRAHEDMLYMGPISAFFLFGIIAEPNSFWWIWIPAISAIFLMVIADKIIVDSWRIVRQMMQDFAATCDPRE